MKTKDKGDPRVNGFDVYYPSNWWKHRTIDRPFDRPFEWLWLRGWSSLWSRLCYVSEQVKLEVRFPDYAKGRLKPGFPSRLSIHRTRPTRPLWGRPA